MTRHRSALHDPARRLRRLASALALAAACLLSLCSAPAGARGVRALSVGAAKTSITPVFFAHGAPFPRTVPPSCVRGTPPGTTPQAYFNGIRRFAFEDPFHVAPGSPRDEYDPAAAGGAGEPFCKLDGRSFRVPEYGHVIDPSSRYEGIYLAGGDGVNRTAKAILRDDPIAAQAIVFAHGRRRVALVTVDSIGTFNADFDRIRHLVARRRRDLAGMRIEISSTHNESAPDPIGIWGPTETTPGVNHLYVAWMVRRVAAAIERAADRARPARLRITETLDPDNFLPCFSSYPYLADRHLHLMQASELGGRHRTIATISEYGIHDETLGFSGEPPRGLALKGPDAFNPRGYYRRVLAGDWAGYFRRDVERRTGGVAMAMAGPNGSVEMPVVFPAGTRVSRRPVVGPGAHAPATDGDNVLGDCGRTAERPPAGVRPATVDQLRRAQLLGRFVSADALSALRRARPTSSTTLDVKTSPPLAVSLRNNALFLLAANFGVFPDRPAFSDASHAGLPSGLRDNALHTEVSLLHIADAQLITLPGETFPQTTIRGPFGPADMPFGGQPVTPWLSAEMSAPHRFFIGLSQDMIGYLMPPASFVGDCVNDDGHGHCLQTQAVDDPWHAWELDARHGSNDRFGQHHSDDSESLGPAADAIVSEATARLLRSERDPRAAILAGRYIDRDGRLDRSPLHGAVGIVVLHGARSLSRRAERVYRFAGARLPAGLPPPVGAGRVMDYDGLFQRRPDESTAGILLGRGRREQRIYVSVYAELAPG